MLINSPVTIGRRQKTFFNAPGLVLCLNHFMRLSIFTAVLLVVATIIFLPVWMGGTLMTTDDNIGNIAGYKSQVAAGFGQEGWSDSPLLGLPAGASALNWSNFWIRYLPLRFFANTFHALSLFAGSIALGIYLFRKNLSLGAVLVAALAAFWVGTNFTLIYAGHIRKFSIVFLFCATLVCLDRLFESRRWGWGAVAGALLGIMFLEQQDVALFFGLFAGAYALFLLARSGERVPGFLRLLPVAVIALMICLGSVVSAYRQNVAGIASMEQSRAEKWEFCTQWSQPPDEAIDFVAPGYTGWRSGEPTGPYWGRMGRSAGWEQTRQGFMNFRLESTYLGLIPILLAVFALFASRSSSHRPVILFWGGAALVSLLLAFGKYTPLYALFWQLPVINNIRNPNKFIQIFQVAVAILAAFGFDALLKDKVSARKFFWVSTGVFGVLILWAIGATAGQAAQAADFSRQGWPSEVARVIAANQTAALWHATLMAGVGIVLFAMSRYPGLQRHQQRLVMALVALLVVDAAWLSRRYVQTLPKGYIEENAVTRYLKNEIGHQRVAMVTQENFYNLWLTYLLPYHGIPHFNFTQMPRMASDYQQFLSALQRNPLRMWQLSGVGFLLGPANLAGQLPPGSYETALRFDVMVGPKGSLSVQESPQGQHAVFKSLLPAPRFALIAGAERTANGAALARMASPEWTPLNQILLPEDSSLDPSTGTGSVGELEVMEQRDGYAKLRIITDEKSYLRVAGKFDNGWKASIDGSPADLGRADFLMQAVPVPAGSSEVELTYAPAGQAPWAAYAGFGLSALAVLSLVFPLRGLKRGKQG